MTTPQAQLEELSDLDALLLPMHNFEVQFSPDPDSNLAQSYKSRLLTATSARVSMKTKTSMFFSQKFRKARLEREPKDISALIDDFQTFTKGVPKFHENRLPKLPEPSIVIPRTEQDVVNMFNEQIKPYIVFLARRDSARQDITKARQQWVPNSSQYPKLPVASLEWRLELVAEAFAKSRKDSEAPSPQLSVRVDEIFVLSATRKDGPITRRHTTVVESEAKVFAIQGSSIETGNGYLRFGQYWTQVDLDRPIKGDIEHLKGLLPLEFKRYGALRKPYFDFISSKKILLSNSTSNTELDRAIKEYEQDDGKLLDTNISLSDKRNNVRSLVAKLQQAIAYAWHYGTDVAVLNDYASSAVIRLPASVWESSAQSSDLTFEWYFMSRSANALGKAVDSDPRKTGTAALAVGLELRRVLYNMEQALNKENDAKTKTKPKP